MDSDPEFNEVLDGRVGIEDGGLGAEVSKVQRSEDVHGREGDLHRTRGSSRTSTLFF